MAFAGFPVWIIAFVVVVLELVQAKVLSVYLIVISTSIGIVDLITDSTKISLKQRYHMCKKYKVRFKIEIRIIFVILWSITMQFFAFSVPTDSKNLSMSKLELFSITSILGNPNSNVPYINLSFYGKTQVKSSHKYLRKMDPNQVTSNISQTQNTEVSDLASKFRKATLELKLAEEIVILNQNVIAANEVVGDREWDFCLIGKIIIEGKMNYGTIEKNIQFTWPFIPREEVKIIEVDTNVMIPKFMNQDLVDKIIEEGPWNIDGKLCILFDYFQGFIYLNLDWTKQVYWIQLKCLQPEQ